MKRFILLTAIFFSSIAMSAGQFDRYARQLKELDANYKAISQFCTNLSLAASVKTVCETELQARIVLEFKDKLNGLVNTVIEKAGSDYDAEQAELKCKAEQLVTVSLINAETPNSILVTNESCLQIKVLISNYYKQKETTCKATAMLEVDAINAKEPGAIVITNQNCDQINRLVSDYKAAHP